MIYYAYEPDDYSQDAAWHHGVPGQKWGVRNGPPYPVRSGTTVRFAKSKMTKSTLAQTNAFKKMGQKISKTVGQKKPSKRLASSLSDDELKSAVSRLKLEKEYQTLIRERKNGWGPVTNKKNNGEQKTNSILNEVGKTFTNELVKGVATYATARMADRANNRAAIDKVKAEYKADVKRKEYSERTKRDEIKANTRTWLNDPSDKTDTGRRVLNAAFSSTAETGDIPWGYDDDLPY